MEKCSTFIIGLRSWQRVGLVVSLENTKPTMTFDFSIVLDRNYAPMTELKAKASTSKRKRVNLFFSPSKKLATKTLVADGVEDSLSIHNSPSTLEIQ